MVEAVKVRGLGSRCLASTAGERRSAVFMREVPDSQDLRVLPEAAGVESTSDLSQIFQNLLRRIWEARGQPITVSTSRHASGPGGGAPKGGVSVIRPATGAASAPVQTTGRA